jgi:membrane protein YqaA with SNARE-associated domain
VDTLLITLAIGNPSLAYLSAALAIAGSTAGCMVLFYVARKGGELYLERHTRSARAQKFRRWFLRYGLVTVFIPVLVPLPLPTKVFVISAGVFGEHSTAWLREHAGELAGIALGLFVFLLLLVKLTDRFHKPSARLG